MLIPFSEITKKYNMKIHGILHIGAHKCEELKTYNNYGIGNNKIIWVEANPILVEYNLNIDKTRIMKNFICCDTDDGKTKLNIANNGQSSSILELGTHSKSYPSIIYNDHIEVNNRRIDTMYKYDKIPNNFANFLNIDIQGAELLALKGMGSLISYFDYIYLEVNKAHVYKKCALVNEIDDYLSTYNYVRVETKWTSANWGDALYIRKIVNNDFKLLKNCRCSEEIFNFKGITLEDALKKAELDPRVKALHWYKKNGGDGRITGINGWYQGAGGSLGTVKNNAWDTILLPSLKVKQENKLSNNIVISFLKSRKAGGIGDRIIGIVNVKLLAKLLNRPFYINWEREDVSEYLNIQNSYTTSKKKIRFSFMNNIHKFIDQDKKTSLKSFLESASLKELNSYFNSSSDCEFLTNIYYSICIIIHCFLIKTFIMM